MVPEIGHCLRIYIGETDKHGSQPLYEWLVRRAREEGMAGVTVLRGIEGYGAHSCIHTARILRLSEDLPVVIEIVDTQERLEDFLGKVDAFITEGLATMEAVQIRFYRGGHQAQEEHRETA
jgi:PII-like signaling protein